MITARYFSMGSITFCSEGCCEGLAVLYHIQKVLIKWRESRGAWARRLVPKRAVRTVGTNNAAQAPLEPVRGCGCSGSSRRWRIVYDTHVASSTPPCTAPATTCTIYSNLFAGGIKIDGINSIQR